MAKNKTSSNARFYIGGEWNHFCVSVHIYNSSFGGGGYGDCGWSYRRSRQTDQQINKLPNWTKNRRLFRMKSGNSLVLRCVSYTFTSSHTNGSVKETRAIIYRTRWPAIEVPIQVWLRLFFFNFYSSRPPFCSYRMYSTVSAFPQ